MHIREQLFAVFAEKTAKGDHDHVLMFLQSLHIVAGAQDRKEKIEIIIKGPCSSGGSFNLPEQFFWETGLQIVPDFHVEGVVPVVLNEVKAAAVDSHLSLGRGVQTDFVFAVELLSESGHPLPAKASEIRLGGDIVDLRQQFFQCFIREGLCKSFPVWEVQPVPDLQVSALGIIVGAQLPILIFLSGRFDEAGRIQRLQIFVTLVLGVAGKFSQLHDPVVSGSHAIRAGEHLSRYYIEFPRLECYYSKQIIFCNGMIGHIYNICTLSVQENRFSSIE